MIEDMKISPEYEVSKWLEIRSSLCDDDNSSAWSVAVDILKDRLNNRFFLPIKLLRDAPGSTDFGFGFAMLTLDCLLIDTIQSFREGRVKGSEKSASSSFLNFFRDSHILQKEFKNRKIVYGFFNAIRCGLMHDGETRNGWLVRTGLGKKIIKPIKDGEGYILDRDKFHEAIVDEFQRYTKELLNEESQLLRENFIKRMDAICGLTATGLCNIYYFAYGSNMDHDQMISRVPAAMSEGVAHLSGYRLIFNKRSRDCTAKANIQPTTEDGAYVLGGLYRMPESKFNVLSRFELGYSTATVQVKQNGAWVLARTFIAEMDSLYRGQPSHSYLDTILKGARRLNLSNDYLKLIRLAGGSDQEDRIGGIE